MIGRGGKERKKGRERKIDWERKIDQKKEEYSIRYNNSNKNNLTPNTSHQHET